MAYDEELAFRIRAVLASLPGIEKVSLDEKAMFGGLAFLINGNMAMAASRSEGDIMVRVAPEDAEDLLADPHAELMVMGGRQMRGWIRVDGPGIATDDDLARWVNLGWEFTRALPAK